MATYLVLALFAIGSLIGWAGYRLQTSSNSQAQDNLENDALRLASGLAEPLKNLSLQASDNARTFDSLLANYALSVDGAVAILDADLQLISISEFDGDSNHSSDDEGQRHEEDDFGVGEDNLGIFQDWNFRSEIDNLDPNLATAASWRSGGRIMASAPLVSPEGDTMGLLLVAISSERATSEINQNWVILLSGGGVILFVTAVATVLVARQVSGPVMKVTSVSEAMAGGDLARRVIPQGPMEVKRLGRAFNEMADRVEETLARQRAFVADAAHELRSPLTSLALRAEMLEQYIGTDQRTRQDYVSQLVVEIDRMRGLAEHLLALSRMDSGQNLKMASIDISPSIEQLCEGMKPLFDSANIRFESYIDAALPTITCDSEALIIAVRNLLDNAIQYTPPGGTAVLRAHAEDGAIIITVSDTGPGIPQEDLDRIFERFYRVDKARSRRQGSSGLGLSLVRAIVQAHGGTVDVTSSAEEGSTFTVALPLNT